MDKKANIAETPDTDPREKDTDEFVRTDMLRDLLEDMRAESDYRGQYEGGGKIGEFADRLEEVLNG